MSENLRIEISVYLEEDGNKASFITEVDREAWEQMDEKGRDQAMFDELMEEGRLLWTYDVLPS